jgi:hypothetical protein
MQSMKIFIEALREEEAFSSGLNAQDSDEDSMDPQETVQPPSECCGLLGLLWPFNSQYALVDSLASIRQSGFMYSVIFLERVYALLPALDVFCKTE